MRNGEVSIMIEIPKFVDTKTIIVNLMKEDKKIYLSLDMLQKFLEYIYVELRKQCKLSGYRISFNVNFEAIERTVLYNKNIFGMDIDGENIYLRGDCSIDELAEQYQVDETIREIIKKFLQ